MKKNKKQMSGTMISNLSIHKKLLMRSKSTHMKDDDTKKILKLTIVEACLTRDIEIFSKMDPYVIINYNGNIMQTPVLQEAGTNPIWNQTFQINY